MKKTNWISVITMLLFIVSCNNQVGSHYEIASDADANAFMEQQKAAHTYKTKIKELNFKLTYITKEEMALRELGDVSNVTQASFDSIAGVYDSLLFFHLEVSIDNFNEEMIHYGVNSGDQAIFDKAVNYYSFEMQKDICLVVGEKDTIPCTMYHYERNYGISPNNKFILGFRALPSNAVLVYDNSYLNTGPVKFALNEQDLLNHSKIKIN